MATATTSVPLSEQLKAYVDAQVSSGDYETTGDFVRELILEDRERGLAKIEHQLEQAMQGEHFPVPLDQIPEGELVTFPRQHLDRAK